MSNDNQAMVIINGCYSLERQHRIGDGGKVYFAIEIGRTIWSNHFQSIKCYDSTFLLRIYLELLSCSKIEWANTYIVAC